VKKKHPSINGGCFFDAKKAVESKKRAALGRIYALLMSKLFFEYKYFETFYR